MQTLDLDRIVPLGASLVRPECVLATASGTVYASDAGGGVAAVAPDGTTRRFLASDAPDGFLPNGICLMADGSFLIADLGKGGVWRLNRDLTLSPFLLEVDGEPLPPTNFVGTDDVGRVWISVSTRYVPRERAFTTRIADGFVVLVDEGGARVAADGIGFANECKVSPDGRHLYVNETIARRLSRFPMLGEGRLGQRETVTEFGDGIFPDGFEFDEGGGIWITSVVSNRIVRLARDGTPTCVVDGSDPDDTEAAQRAWAEDRFARDDIRRGEKHWLGNLSSIAFGGPDRSTALLGSLVGTRLWSFRVPIPGVRPPHWEWRADLETSDAEAQP